VSTWRTCAAGAVLCAAAFTGIALYTESQGIPAPDRTIGAGVHAWVVDHPPWPEIARIGGTVTQPTNLRILAVLVALALIRFRRLAAASWLIVTLALTAVLGSALKGLFERPRPVWPDPISVIGGWSFPSGHAINAAAAAGCSIVLLRMINARSARARRGRAAGHVLAVGVALVAGVDRILLGVHFATDVVAGWIAGAGVVLATMAVWQAISAVSGMRPPHDQIT